MDAKPATFARFGLPSYSRVFSLYKLRMGVYRHFKAEAAPGMKVLDVGCGQGVNIKLINKLYDAAGGMEFHGVDISAERIKEATAEMQREGLENCRFKVGAAENTGYGDADFNIVICTEVLEHLPDPQAALKEFHRVLKPGGCAIVTTPNAADLIARIAGRRVKERIKRDVIARDPQQIRDGSYGHISVLSSRQLIAASSSAGFKVERMDRGSIVYGWRFYDRHQLLFALLLIADWALDRLPFSRDLSWGIIARLRKPAAELKYKPA